MPLELTKFTGTAPYASERFGIYEPLIGWKSIQTKRRINRAVQQLTTTIIQSMISNAQINRTAKLNVAAVIRPEMHLPIPAPIPLVTRAANRTAQAVSDFIENKGRHPQVEEWSTLVRSALVEKSSDDSKSISAVSERVTSGMLQASPVKTPTGIHLLSIYVSSSGYLE